MTEARTYMDGYSDGKEWAQADILYTVEPMTAVGVDAALARLAITEEANSMLLARNKWLEHTLEVAGASPVEPNFCESCAMDLSTCDCVTPRPVFVNQLPSAQPSQAVFSDAKSLLMPATAAPGMDGKILPVDMSRLPKGAI